MSEQLDTSRLQPFGNLEFIARQVVEGFIVGLHKSPFHGFSVEFSEHRLYNPGESIRHIDWKLYGRTERLYVKRYEEETNLRCQIVIDNSSSMYFPVRERLSADNPNKVIFSIYSAASIMNLLHRQRDAVGLSLFSNDVELHTQAKSSSVHYKYILGELEKLLTPVSLQANKPSMVAESLHNIAENIHKRSMVILFSDMFSAGYDHAALFDALQHLKYNKHEVILFHVVDKLHELDFGYDNRPHRFVDMETGEEIKLQPSQVRTSYVRAVNDYIETIKMKCGQYRIDFVEADIKRGFRQVLFPYLLKREKML
ncbi:MAG TPA: DUF58 domain-containing protein [Bacteroidales bacterium]|nr:DUF58 domain-containing protein [Bacteroidales bacterium]HPT01989.1 DUF58 domain-containing protein [Bacteroidales bacterium]